MQNQTKSEGMDWRIVLGIGALIIIIALIIGIVVFSGGEDDEPEEEQPTVTVVVEASATDTSVPPTALPTENATAAVATDQANQTATAEQWTATPTITPIPAGYPGGPEVITNSEWVPVARDFEYDDYTVTMVLVPRGCFQMGNDETALYVEGRGWNRDGVPDGGTICFDQPFWIDQYEVSNAQFHAFMSEDGSELDETTADLPHERISWNDALAFCTEQREARLPTEAEWEYAGRGPDALKYPWGDEFDGTKLNCSEQDCPDDNYTHRAPVDTFEAGQSWVGAHHFSGNVPEWTYSLYLPYPYDPDLANEVTDDTSLARSIRGGDSGGGWDITLLATRASQSADGAAGFRCARDYEIE